MELQKFKALRIKTSDQGNWLIENGSPGLDDAESRHVAVVYLRDLLAAYAVNLGVKNGRLRPGERVFWG